MVEGDDRDQDQESSSTEGEEESFAQSFSRRIGADPDGERVLSDGPSVSLESSDQTAPNCDDQTALNFDNWCDNLRQAALASVRGTLISLRQVSGT
jgi:hypothetical protein